MLGPRPFPQALLDPVVSNTMFIKDLDESIKSNLLFH